VLLWKIIEDEESDELLLEIEKTNQDKRVIRPLCAHPDRGRQFLHDIINGHPDKCLNMLRMWSVVFTKLCSDLSDMYGLRDTYNMSAMESVAIFLHMCGHNIIERTAMHTFGHSAETISRKFHEVLGAVVLMAIDMFTQDPTTLMQGFVGAIDGTHISAMVSGRDKRRYLNRHGDPTMNILATYKARYNVSMMRKIVVATMALHNYIQKSDIVDPDFQSAENANEYAMNEEDTQNTMEENLSSTKYMEGVRAEIANVM
ncbi:hypothetical protein EUTSA_v10015872mg, partial [Eutrema salsugineum]